MSAVEKGLYLNWNTLCMSYWCSFFSCQQFDSNVVLRLFFLKSIHLYVRFCSSDALCHRWNNHGNYNLLANFVGLIFIIWKNTFPENCWLHASKMNHPEITKKKDVCQTVTQVTSENHWRYEHLRVWQFIWHHYCYGSLVLSFDLTPFSLLLTKAAQLYEAWSETHAHTHTPNRCTKASRIMLSLHVPWVGGLLDLWRDQRWWL